MTNIERLNANNIALQECIDTANTLPTADSFAPDLQTKTVTPTTDVQDVVADEEFDGLDKVIVNPIPSEYIVPSGSLEVTENGDHDVKTYESVVVNVPIPEGYIVPSGELEISENGIHDVTSYASVNVNVESSGGGFPNGTEWTLLDTDFIPSSKVVNLSCRIWVGVDSSGIYYSTDGITWTASNITRTTTTYFGAPRWVNGEWTVIEGYTNHVYRSTDGISWTEFEASMTFEGSGLYYADGLWQFYCTKGIFYSTDGITWTQSNITAQCRGVLRSETGLWVASGYNAPLWYSTDGKTWTQSNIAANKGEALYYKDGLWIAHHYRQNYFLYSTDGITWTQSYEMEYIQCLRKDCGIWVCGRYAYQTWSTGLFYSTDGITWTASNITTGSVRYVNYSNGVWVACIDNAGLYYSTDGKTWTQSNITNLVWTSASNDNNGKWIAYNSSGGCAYSLTWAPQQ